MKYLAIATCLLGLAACNGSGAGLASGISNGIAGYHPAGIFIPASPIPSSPAPVYVYQPIPSVPVTPLPRYQAAPSHAVMTCAPQGIGGFSCHE